MTCFRFCEVPDAAAFGAMAQRSLHCCEIDLVSVRGYVAATAEHPNAVTRNASARCPVFPFPLPNNPTAGGIGNTGQRSEAMRVMALGCSAVAAT